MLHTNAFDEYGSITDLMDAHEISCTSMHLASTDPLMHTDQEIDGYSSITPAGIPSLWSLVVTPYET
ncbi:hypothetical protein ACFXG4_50535 [Nocardia sp. NPDC059246]|uniref:hypothetical protein n=1 Tax=unclassified Nocardia TaxID=2637762 RepID=UPI00369AD1E3